MQAARQAVIKAQGLLAVGPQGLAGMWGPGCGTRPLSALLTLRGFHQRPAEAQAAAGGSAAPAAGSQAAAAPLPWTPTRELAKRKVLPKRMAHLLKVQRAAAQPHCAGQRRAGREGGLLQLHERGEGAVAPAQHHPSFTRPAPIHNPPRRHGCRS